MAEGLTNRSVLDSAPPREMVLELLSFSGGENTIGADQELGLSEGRLIKNWASTSVGSMIRQKGMSEIAEGSGAGYTGAWDLLIEHFEGTSTELYGLIEGDLVTVSGSTVVQEDASAFTTGVLSQAVSAGDKCWITNATDNMKYKTIAGSITTPTDQPATACDRVSEHKSRLVAEGDGSGNVYGSRAGSGNWTAADGWSASGDAWSITLPDITKGHYSGFPSGGDIAVFTKFDTYIIQNIPNVTSIRLQNGIGCGAEMSIARGNEGIYFVSEFPTLGVFLWDGVQFTNLTENHDFVENIDLSKRCYGVYRDRKYYLIYNESGSGTTVPNRIKIFDARFARWHERAVNSDVGHTLGYPALLRKTNNELYVGASDADELYELDDTTTSDDGNNTEAEYKTKVFTSRDWKLGTGNAFPIDGVKLKLIKVTVKAKGTTGVFSIQWTADRGKVSGQQTFDLTADGDEVNVDFTVNTSNVITLPPLKTQTKTFSNSALGDEFQFQIINRDTGSRPEIKSIKFSAIALEET